MSDQRVSGNPSGQWHYYSELASSQTSNNSAPSSGQRASTSLFGDLAPVRQAVQHPPILQPGMVSRSSAKWLDAYQNSSEPGKRELAAAVMSGIQNGSLTLGNPASQSAMRAQYGRRLETPHGAASLVVNFRTRADGRFDLVSAGMRNSANRSRQVTITAPRNISSPGQAQPATNPAPSPPAAPPPAQKPQIPVQCPETPVAGPSSQPLQPVDAPRAFSAPISSGITQILNGLPRWDQQAARTQIEARLSSVPENEQQIMLMHLTTQLSGKSSDAKPAIIRNWAETASVARAMEARDMRTDREREQQNMLDAQNKNPAFSVPRDAILDMLHSTGRKIARDIYIDRGGFFRSPLYRRVFRDSRGPVAAINEIRALIAPLHEEQRYQAIKDWDPR